MIFGHAKGGTPLMAARQTAGIDLPLKALAWQDADGKVWLSYNDAAWILAAPRSRSGQRRRCEGHGGRARRRRQGGHNRVDGLEIRNRRPVCPTSSATIPP